MFYIDICNYVWFGAYTVQDLGKFKLNHFLLMLGWNLVTTGFATYAAWIVKSDFQV